MGLGPPTGGGRERWLCPARGGGRFLQAARGSSAPPSLSNLPPKAMAEYESSTPSLARVGFPEDGQPHLSLQVLVHFSHSEKSRCFVGQMEPPRTEALYLSMQGMSGDQAGLEIMQISPALHTFACSASLPPPPPGRILGRGEEEDLISQAGGALSGTGPPPGPCKVPLSACRVQSLSRRECPV